MEYFKSFMENRFVVYSRLSCGLIAILVGSLTHYAVVTLAIYRSVDRNKNDRKTPPVVPHFLPFFGSIPWQYLWNPIDFLTSR
jgi:hypothetical protein